MTATEPATEPIPFTTTRFRCPFCARGAAKKSRCREHIARCWKNPAARGCKTCKHYEPGHWERLPTPGHVWACAETEEHCTAGLDLSPHGEPSDADYRSGGPIVGCDLWEADR